MSRIHVEAQRVIAARPETVYTFLADYRKRPQILTPNYLDYSVEQGGQGAGTVFRYRFQAAKRERAYHMQVDEPQKGKELRERDTGSSLMTAWQVSPASQGQESRVVLTTEWEGSGGIGGFFERTFAPRELQRIYIIMLDQLALALSPSDVQQKQPIR